ncbi:glutamyl-tRNA reductase-binding protein, chloroplastic [Cucurbita moschata]|uniref:Glutamyl-tRNA reductase-binding protein, chloroplastic n=1 Tax=Cucurbita moschata TaxID=3662 RepID=A0A6J1EGN2_CUCMO|nr:glutamyl-tRNA reductase-binding protein, chloroplastic [Cucurbita moschata]
MATVTPPSLTFQFRSRNTFNGRIGFHFPRSLASSFNPRLRFRLPFSMAASTESTSQAVASGDDANSDEIDVSKLIQAHQEKAARLLPAEEIRTLLDQSVRGMLSTFSRSFEGYPSGSFVDFACDADGTPILAVSSLAEHAKNLAANPKCSLLVAKEPEDRGTLVVTVHGDAVPVSEEDRPAVRAAYLSKHPNAFWVDFGDFQFVYIKPKVIRYVSGVATASLGSGELSSEEYKAAQVDPIVQFAKPVMSHMNRDHTEDTKMIVRHWSSIPVDSAIMLDLDSLGFNVKASYQGNSFKLRVPFPRRAENRKDVKTLIVEMLEAAKPQV